MFSIILCRPEFSVTLKQKQISASLTARKLFCKFSPKELRQERLFFRYNLLAFSTPCPVLPEDGQTSHSSAEVFAVQKAAEKSSLNWTDVQRRTGSTFSKNALQRYRFKEMCNDIAEQSMPSPLLQLQATQIAESPHFSTAFPAPMFLQKTCFLLR